MVLRAFLTFFILFSLVEPGIARTRKQRRDASKRDKRTFKKAKAAYSNGRYNLSLSILKKRYDLKSAATPSGALQLAAWDYEKLGAIKNAQNIYAILIKSRFKSINTKVLRSYNKNGNADDLPDEIPEKLLTYYHKRAEMLVQIYMREYAKSSNDRRERFRKNAKRLLDILTESDYEEDDAVEELLANLERFVKAKKDKIYNTNYYGSFDYISWRDKIELVTPSGLKVNLKTSNQGYCVGGGVKFENATYVWNLGGCYAFTNATVGTSQSEISYFQKNVPVNMLMFTPGTLWKPRSGEVAIGMSFPLAYRSGDFTEPEGYTLESKVKFTYGYLLEGHWKLNPLDFVLKFGKVVGMSSSLWSFGLRYNL